MRRLIVLLLIGLLTGSIVSAQDSSLELPTIYCGGLSEADCQLLNSIVSNLPNLHSATIDINAQYWQSDKENPIDFMKVRGVLNGSLNIEAFRTSSSTALLDSLNADLTISAPLSSDGKMAFGEDADLTDIHLILQDGILYVRLGDLQSMLKDASLPAWGCYDLKSTLTAQLDKADNKSTSQNYEIPLTGFDLLQLSEVLGIEVAQQYAVVSRSAENGLVTFETRLDLAGLYADPAYQEALRYQIENVKELAGWSVSTITDQHLERLAQAAAILFPEPILLNRYAIDTETGFMRSLYAWSTEEWYFSMQAAMQGQDVSKWLRSGMILTIDVADFNQAAPIIVPTDARPFDSATFKKIEVLNGLIPLPQGVQSSGTCGT